MRFLLFGTLCGMALGCNQNNPPALSAKSTAEPAATSVTANRSTLTEPIDRTNTGVNIRDRNSTAKTPLDQNENKADIDITAEIRKRVVESKMSVNAHNVKIITQDGTVTLRGPVKTEEEKRTIEQIALTAAGTNKVDNQLEVNHD